MCSFSVYSVGPAEIVDPLIYEGFVEELVEVLESKEPGLMVGGTAAHTHTHTHTRACAYAHTRVSCPNKLMLDCIHHFH